jgi:hypothetical protein
MKFTGMSAERAPQNLSMSTINLSSSIWGPRFVGGAQSGTERL